MYAISISWSASFDKSNEIETWAKENCPSYFSPKIRVIKTSIGGIRSRISSTTFEFTNESDAISFALKWK